MIIYIEFYFEKQNIKPKKKAKCISRLRGCAATYWSDGRNWLLHFSSSVNSCCCTPSAAAAEQTLTFLCTFSPSTAGFPGTRGVFARLHSVTRGTPEVRLHAAAAPASPGLQRRAAQGVKCVCGGRKTKYEVNYSQQWSSRWLKHVPFLLWWTQHVLLLKVRPITH